MKDRFKAKKREEIIKVFADRINPLLWDAKKEGISQETIANLTGIDTGSLSKYRNTNQEAPISALCKLADYFNVSTDYLLGRSDVPRRDPDLDMIQKYTGLSFDAIALLHDMCESEKEYKKSDDPFQKALANYVTDFINSLLVSSEFKMLDDILFMIKAKSQVIRESGYTTVSSWDYTDYVRAGQYHASLEFSKFLEKYIDDDIRTAELNENIVRGKKLPETKEGL